MIKDFVSVIIPCFGDYWFYLPTVIESLKDQNDKRFEVIIQHGNSVAEARNEGVKKSVGEYILLLDADDKIHQDYIKRILERKADILMIGYMEFGESTAIGKLSTEYTYERALMEDLFIISAAFKREFFEDFKDIDREDREFWARLLKKGAKVDKIDEILFFYGKHGKSRSSNLCV